MSEPPHNTLPNVEQIRIAIATWFRGGGTTNLIVNVCRREQATLVEATALAERLGHRIASGKDYVTDEVVSQQLEAVRAVVLSQEEAIENEAKSPSPPLGSAEWHRRAAEMAQRNAWAEKPYKAWKWEKPAAQRRRFQ